MFLSYLTLSSSSERALIPRLHNTNLCIDRQPNLEDNVRVSCKIAGIDVQYFFQAFVDYNWVFERRIRSWNSKEKYFLNMAFLLQEFW